MMSMMPGTGMGAAGTGMGAGPSMPATNGLSPQLLAMLAAMQSGGSGGMPPAPGPLQAPTTGTPMANMIGAGGMPPGGMPHPGGMMPPPGAVPGMNGGTLPGATPMPNMQSPQIMQLLQQLKGQQTGVPATGGATQMAPGPNPGMIQGLLAQWQAAHAGMPPAAGGSMPPSMPNQY